MRFTWGKQRFRFSRFLRSVRDSVPSFILWLIAIIATIDVIRWLAPVIRKGFGSLSALWSLLPNWLWTLVGLFVVVVVVGVAAAQLYAWWETSVLVLRFGRSPIGIRLQRLARQDFRMMVDAIEDDLRVTRPYAVLTAIVRRAVELPVLISSLKRLRSNLSDNMYSIAIENVRRGWKDGLQGSTLRDYLHILARLPADSQRNRIHGQVVAANITYLLGDLQEGRRLADRIMEEAEGYDVSKLPVYQWLASYAHANSRLFLGQFDPAATLLGERWQTKYTTLSQNDRMALRNALSPLSTLNPLASVGRHILLASAFAGKPIKKRETEPDPQNSASSSSEWARAWYNLSLELGTDEPITLDFTRAYMALYCLLVETVYDPLELLNEIDDNSPPVSQYAKYGMRGLVHAWNGDLDPALSDLRRADTQSRLSGNRFFEGVFLPAQAAVAQAADPSHYPEATRLLRRARSVVELSGSPFYSSQIDAARAVIACSFERKGEAKQLLKRSRNLEHGFLTLYSRILAKVGC